MVRFFHCSGTTESELFALRLKYQNKRRRQRGVRCDNCRHWKEEQEYAGVGVCLLERERFGGEVYKHGIGPACRGYEA